MQYPGGPSVPGAFQFFTLRNFFSYLSLVILMLSCFTVPLSCLSTFLNHFVSSLCVTGWSHISLLHLTLSWLPGFMSLLLQLRLVCLKHSFLNILLCSCSYLLGVDDVATNLCFSYSNTNFSPLSFSYIYFPPCLWVASLWISSLPHRPKWQRSFFNKFILSFLLFFCLGTWGLVVLPLHNHLPSKSDLLGVMFSVTT